MKKASLLLVLLVLLAVCAPAFADGKFYGSESVPPSIPYQRAMLWFDGSQETLLVQSKYQAPASEGERFGWVVPVPSVPELASMDPGSADDVFRQLDYVTSPRVTRVSPIVLNVLFVAVNLAAALALLACLLSLFVPGMEYVRQHRPALLVGAILVLLPMLSILLLMRGQTTGPSSLVPLLLGPVSALLTLLACLLSFFVPGLQRLEGNRVILTTSALLSLAILVPSVYFLMAGRAEGRHAAPAGVEIIKAERVGIYDVRVVRAGQAGGLIEWLNENGFQFDENDQQVFDDYLGRGWSFVLAQVDPGRSPDQQEVAFEGLAAPLIMRFPADAPVYPLALTSTTGHETEILLYAFSQGKLSTGGRLELHFARSKAGQTWYPWRGVEEGKKEAVEPPGFFGDRDSDLPYLCKFKGTLSPEQMQEDLVLTPAEDQQDFRKRIIVW